MLARTCGHRRGEFPQSPTHLMKRYSAQTWPSSRSSAIGVGARFASLIRGRAEYCHASRAQSTVTLPGLATCRR